MNADHLNCGCPSGNATYWCMWCDNSRCDRHRDNQHICPECEACGFKHGYPLHEWVGRRLVQVGTVRLAS